MAFLRMSMSSTIIVIVMFLLNNQPSIFFRADDELIRQVCHKSKALTTCTQCVKADIRSYVYKDDFAANQTITKCGKLFSHAKSYLNAVTQDLKNGDYDASDKSIFNALLYHNSCKDQCENNPKIVITSHIFHGFKMYEELSQIALSILNHL
ncbi:hypothetical protein C5167_017305 [Papaver somniferum]|uniref:Pectinesterase inhibitor domain-containing protein n=1 Tax=Papaver somniferum TaxID=3469 RepID=A0A4Y7IN18_PAPSO|nr:hypothetical protein C5167_017305 [Papaver somniferum]